MLRLFAGLCWSALLLLLLVCVPARAAVNPLSDDAGAALARVLATADHQGRPFAIVDKRAARLFLFEADGQLRGSAPVLLGLARGDTAIADIAQRHPSSLAPHERSTPAGRFESHPGHNDRGEAIVWIDHAAALAIHRLRPAPAREHRPERLASPTPDDNRISLGCIVVPVAFYAQQVEPLLGQRPGVVYVLPERGPALALFDTLSAGPVPR